MDWEAVVSTHHSWRFMIDRCTKPHSISWPDYGGRGIRVCDRWLTSFNNFVDDLGVRPPKMTLERINNAGNYEPANCRWATKYEQSMNRRTTRFITADGQTLHLAEWARRLGCHPTVLLSRLDRGVSEQDAVTRPIKVGRNKGPNTRMLTALGHTRPLHVWAKSIGASHSTILARLKSGMSVEQAVTKLPENPNQKLTIQRARNIRELYVTGGLSAAKIAKKYNVSKKTILNILHGVTFREG